MAWALAFRWRSVAAALPRRRRLPGRCGAGNDRSRCRGLPAEAAPLVSGRMPRVRAPPRSTGLLAAAVILVDDRPGAALGFLLADTALFIAFGDEVRFA